MNLNITLDGVKAALKSLLALIALIHGILVVLDGVLKRWDE